MMLSIRALSQIAGSVSACENPAAGNPNKDDCAHIAQALNDEANNTPYFTASAAGVSQLVWIR